MIHHKFEALDGLRGLLALTIAAYHFKILWHFQDTALLNASYLAVDFFFVLSGFVITHASAKKLETTRDGAVFAVRRFGRIWPLHALVIAGFVGNELLKMAIMTFAHIVPNDLPFDPAGQNALATLPANLLMLHGVGLMDKLTWNGPSWSIGSEFYTYLLFAAVFVYGKKHFTWLAGGLIALSMVGLVALAPDMNTSFAFGILRCVAGFFLGYFIYRLWQRGPKVMAHANLAETGCVVLVGTFAAVCYAGKASLLAPFVMAVPVWVLAHQQGWVSKLLTRRPVQWLGLWSYGMYMVHSLIIVFVSQALTVVEKVLHRPFHATAVNAQGVQQELITLNNIWLTDALMVSYLAVVVLTAALAYRWVENPARGYFNRRASLLRRGSMLLRGQLRDHVRGK